MSKYNNSIVGLATGDAIGYPLEFNTINEISQLLPLQEYVISDDTQMTLALHNALQEQPSITIMEKVINSIINHFISWSQSPLNDRAPGLTCMRSLDNIFTHDNQWWLYSVDSLGSGAVMRSAPAAFLSHESWEAITVLQALITHNLPAAAVSALTLNYLIRNSESINNYHDEALYYLRNIGDISNDFIYNIVEPVLFGNSLSDWLISGAHYKADYGYSLLENIILSKDSLSIVSDDFCEHFAGEGWDSVSAVTAGVRAADLFAQSGDSIGTLHDSVRTSGDSDTIGAVSGALIGARFDQQDYWFNQEPELNFENIYHNELRNVEKPDFILI